MVTGRKTDEAGERGPSCKKEVLRGWDLGHK